MVKNVTSALPTTGTLTTLAVIVVSANPKEALTILPNATKRRASVPVSRTWKGKNATFVQLVIF